VSVYEEVVRTAVEAVRQEYELIKAEHVKDWKLGDIDLVATEDVVVPPAGIRGRIVSIKAKKLVLEEGEIEGSVQLDIEELIGPIEDLKDVVGGSIGKESVLPAFSTPPPTPPVSPPPAPAASAGGLSLGLSGTTGTLATSLSSASTVAEAVTEGVRDSAAADTPEEEVAKGTPGGAEDERKKAVRSVRLKRGVTIEVQVTADKQL
jgi:hypothetical protein